MIRRLVALVAFLAVAFGLTAAIGLKIKGFTLADRYEVSATFDDVTGLFAGDPVKLAGVAVGQVSSIKLEHGKAHVRLSIDRAVRLPREGSSVTVRWRNIIGQRDLYLKPGPISGATADLLPDDGTGTIDHTEIAVDVGAVLGALGPLGQAVNPQQLNDIFTAIAQALDGNDANIDNLVQSLVTVSGVVASRDETIKQMLVDYQSVTSVLASRDEQIQAMVDNIALLSQSFTDNTQLFESALGNLSDVGVSVDQLLTRNEQQLHALLDNLASVAGVVAEKLPALEQAFGGLPAALQALFSSVNGGNFLRVDATCLQFDPAPCTLLGGYSVP